MRLVKKYFIGFFYLMLLILEWAFELVVKLWVALHEAVKDLAAALGTIYSDLNMKKG